MKSGKTLVELAKTLEDIRENSRDFLVPASKLRMAEDLAITFENGTKHAFKPNTHSHGQIAGYSGVPKAYYDRLSLENPALLAKNVNHGFEFNSVETTAKGGKPETRMVRTLHGQARALVSSSYRRLDSADLCDAILPVLADNRMEVVSSELTDTRMYLKALMPKLKADILTGK